MADASTPANNELIEHNRRVLRWAKASDRKYRNTLLLLGWAADRDTHQTVRISWPKLIDRSRGWKGGPLRERTVQRHVAELEALGVVKVNRGKQDFTDKHRGMQAANSYLLDFSKTVADGSAVGGYDFAAPLKDDYSPRNGQQETVIGQQGGQQVGLVSSSSSLSSKDQIRSPSPSPGGGRVPFTVELARVPAASKPSAADRKNPSVDARLTGSAETDLIRSTFFDPIEQEMASEFVKVLRGYDFGQVVKAAGFFFSENSWALSRVRNPRAYARKCVDAVRETLDGWKAREERSRRWRESARREAEAWRAAEERRQQEAAEHEARGDVRIEVLAAECWGQDVPEWLPRDQAVQVPGPGGELVWVPRTMTTRRPPGEIDYAALIEGIDLGEPHANSGPPPGEPDAGFGLPVEPGITMAETEEGG